MGVVGTASRIASLGNGDDTQATEFKRYLGTPAKDNEYTKISSLVANKYMSDGSNIYGNVQSVEMMTSIETLYDCADTLETADQRLTRYKLAKTLALEASKKE